MEDESLSREGGGPVHDKAQPFAERIDVDQESTQRDPISARGPAIPRRGFVAEIVHRQRQVQFRSPASPRGRTGTSSEREVRAHGRDGSRRRPVPAFAKATPVEAAQAPAELTKHARADEGVAQQQSPELCGSSVAAGRRSRGGLGLSPGLERRLLAELPHVLQLVHPAAAAA